MNYSIFLSMIYGGLGFPLDYNLIPILFGMKKINYFLAVFWLFQDFYNKYNWRWIEFLHISSGKF